MDFEGCRKNNYRDSFEKEYRKALVILLDLVFRLKAVINAV